jgi:hypothetical protein
MNASVAQSRLRRTLWIHRLLQLFLVGLMLVTALHFQQLFVSQGRSQAFLHSILFTLLIQAALFVPIRRFALAEADRERISSSGPLTAEMQTRLHRQCQFSDLLKAAIFLFFLAFVVLAPAATTVLCTVFFSFVLSVLTFLHCYGYGMRQWVST